jgi:hypothetical protein
MEKIHVHIIPKEGEVERIMMDTLGLFNSDRWREEYAL